MPDETKRKYAFWLRPSTVALAEDVYSRDNCKSRSEYVEKAVLFYTGYISEKDSTQFLSRTLTSIMRGMLDDTENRIASLLFKLTVEMGMAMNVIAVMGDVDDETLRKLRAKCVEESKRTNGSISFAGVVKSLRGRS